MVGNLKNIGNRCKKKDNWERKEGSISEINEGAIQTLYHWFIKFVQWYHFSLVDEETQEKSPMMEITMKINFCFLLQIILI